MRSSLRFLMSIVSLSALFLPSTVNAANEKSKPVQNIFEAHPGLRRQKGQTEFITATRAFYARSTLAGARLEAASEGGLEGASSPRAQQESDVFKVGPKGSKLLYLLNNYRGLQVVDFAKGALAPEIIGRAPATGNYPEDMYLDEKNQRILVLERNWTDATQESASRLLVYDMKDAKNPKLVKTLPIVGNIADSRIVGDVLYVSSWTYSPGRSDSPTSFGQITSFNLTNEIKEVQTYRTAHPISGREALTILEEKTTDNKYRYYVAASTNKDVWSGSLENSSLELVDISNPTGEISHVLTVQLKGQMLHRGWMQLRNGRLVVVSNYMSEQRIGRIAVESFLLPTPETTTKAFVIDEKEAKYRLMHIEHELSSYNPEKRKAYREAVYGNSNTGLKRFFVDVVTKEEIPYRKVDGRWKGGEIKEHHRLNKWAPDTSFTLGDDQGQHASVQDVRFTGNELYIFWVPANQIDPMDLFDLSRGAPEYRGRLQFDGWIAKSKPVEFNGRRFVIGLGWIFPPVDNEENRRAIQIKLFEVKDEGEKVVHRELDSLTLPMQNTWAYFNGEDKLTTFKISDDGTGSVLFSANSLSSEKAYVAGGKILYFDLKNADKRNVFKEGAFLVGDSSWLKRVFENPETEKLQTFSDRVLGTFNADAKTMESNGFVKAASVLELAREIISYKELSVGKNKIGVQLIRGGDYQNPRTAIRLFQNEKAADVEGFGKVQTVLLGDYSSHLWVGPILYIATIRSVYDEKISTYITTHLVKKIDFAKGLSRSSTWVNDGATLGRPRRGSQYTTFQGFLSLSTNKLLYANGEEFKVIDSDEKGNMSVSDIEWAYPLSKEIEGIGFTHLDGIPYMVYSEGVPSNYEGLNLSRVFVAQISETSKGKWSLGTPINIPGKPFMTTKPNHLVSQDEVILDFPDEDCGNQPAVCEMGLTSLEIKDGKAVLVDRLAYDKVQDLTPVGDRAIAVESDSRRDSLRGIWEGGPWQDRVSGNGQARFQSISFTGDLSFVKTPKLIAGLKLKGTISIQYAKNLGNDEYLAVITDGNESQVLRWNGGERPRAVAVRIVDTTLNPGEPATVFKAPIGARWGYTPKDQTITMNETRIFIADGLSGICEIVLSEEAIDSQKKTP